MLTRKADIGGSRIQVFEINQAILDALGALGASGCMTGLMSDRTPKDVNFDTKLTFLFLRVLILESCK